MTWSTIVRYWRSIQESAGIPVGFYKPVPVPRCIHGVPWNTCATCARNS